MNIVFWGETHRSGTTANYTAMAGILPHLCPDRKIVCGSLQRERCEDSALFLWDAGVCSPAGQKKLLLTADLVVVNFEPQDYDGMEPVLFAPYVSGEAHGVSVCQLHRDTGAGCAKQSISGG